MSYNPPTRENVIPPTVVNSLHSKLHVSSCYQDGVRSLGRSRLAGPAPVRADQLSDTAHLKQVTTFPALSGHRDSLQCLCPRAYGSDVEKSPRSRIPSSGKLSWEEMTQQGEQQG